MIQKYGDYANDARRNEVNVSISGGSKPHNTTIRLTLEDVGMVYLTSRYSLV